MIFFALMDPIEILPWGALRRFYRARKKLRENKVVFKETMLPPWSLRFKKIHHTFCQTYIFKTKCFRVINYICFVLLLLSAHLGVNTTWFLVISHLSCVTCHLSCVTCHLSPVTWPPLYWSSPAMKDPDGLMMWLRKVWW